MASFSSQPMPDWVAAVLTPLASMPGVLWCGLLERPQSRLHLLPAVGPESSSLPRDNTVAQVLVDAILTAATALGEQLHQGSARELMFAFQDTGLMLITPPTPGCAILLAHAQGPGTTMLRLALHQAAESYLGIPDVSSGEPSIGAADALIASSLSNPDMQSEVYNPFTSA